MGDPYAEFQKPSAPDPYAEFQGSAPAAPPDSAPVPQTPGAVRRFASNLATGAGVTSNEEAKSFFRHPIDTLKGSFDAQGELALRAKREFKSGDYLRAATHGIEYLLPGVGPTLAKGGDQLESGDYAGGAGTTLGAAVNVVATPEKVSRGLSKVGELRAGMKMQPFARKVTGVEPAVKEAVTKAAEKHGTELAENKVARVDAVKKNLETQRAANTAIDREKMAVGEKNKGIEAANQEQASQVAKRGDMAKTVDEQSNQLHGHLKKVEASVAKEADAKFERVKEKIGNPEVAPDALVATVRGIEDSVLQGIPENIKEFRAIVEHGGEAGEGLADAFERTTGEAPLGGKPITWDKLQSLKSRIDARLRKSRNMNGDLKRGLYQLRDSVVNEHMGPMAEAGGAKGEWAEARDFWRNYKQDFHEPTGPSGSGSPVAQALDAADPRNIRQPFLRTNATTGNRGTQILRKYPEHGGNEAAAHAESLIGNHESMLKLPEKVSPKALKSAPEVHEMPASKPAPSIPESPTVDATKVAREAIANRAKNWGQFNARDVGILASSSIGGAIGSLFGGHGTFEGAVAGPIAYEAGKFAMSRVMNRPGVIRWLSETPAEEAAAISRIPGADKVKVITGLTDEAVAAAKSGKPVRLSPQAKTLLGAANVARIVAAQGATNLTPGEARDKMRQLSPQ